MPLTAQVIADVGGRDATLALAKKCQHRYLYIPQRAMYDTDLIVRTIGRDLAERLQSEFQGELVPLARCASYYTSKRNAEIRAARLAGKKISVIAKEFRLSKKQIQLILKPHLAKRQRQRVRDRRLKKRRAEK